MFCEKCLNPVYEFCTFAGFSYNFQHISNQVLCPLPHQINLLCKLILLLATVNNHNYSDKYIKVNKIYFLTI